MIRIIIEEHLFETPGEILAHIRKSENEHILAFYNSLEAIEIKDGGIAASYKYLFAIGRKGNRFVFEVWLSHQRIGLSLSKQFPFLKLNIETICLFERI